MSPDVSSSSCRATPGDGTGSGLGPVIGRSRPGFGLGPGLTIRPLRVLSALDAPPTRAIRGQPANPVTWPTHAHGPGPVTSRQAMPADIAGEVVDVPRGRTLVAHNVVRSTMRFAVEAEIAEAELLVDFVMCTVELARRLRLGVDNLRLETLAAYWGAPPATPHDAFDDVRHGILAAALESARARIDVWLSAHPVTRWRRC